MENMEKNYSVIQDSNGRMVVVIHDILFHGKRRINWKEVEAYLKRYIGKNYEVISTGDRVYIGKEFPDEFSGSVDTAKLQGTLAKAKANAGQGIPQLIENATNKRYKNNLAKKHECDAMLGWYRYTTRFALPVYGNDGEIVRYNIFRVEALVRQEEDGTMYLYDLVNIKKENEHPA